MFISNIVCHLIALCFLNSYHGLEQLPKDIAPTEEIRDVVNQIFYILKLKRKKDSKLSEYSTIHKHFVGLTQLENDGWKRLTKLTTIDSRIDNSTTDLTTIINDILNEENNTVESATPNDDDVNEYIENFLSTLARLKETYLVNDSYRTINTDVLEHFYRNSVSENNNNHTEVDEVNSTENNNSSDELEFWSPTETRRIFRGKKTKIKYFPFLASVHLFNQFTCAGSIIKSSLVITAASCLQLAYNNRFFRENPAFLAVRIGSPFFNAGGERIPVLEVYFHPTYSPLTLKDNIAIMRLEKIIKFRRTKRNVRKIDLDRNNWNLPVNTDGVTIAGWGAKTPSNQVLDPWSNKVSMAVLPIYPLEDCQDIYSKEYVGRKNFCAGFMSKGGGACNRDVGAPGVVHGILTGIASFGAPSCGTIDAPTVFTKVGYYYDWIETIMEQEVPRIRIKTTLRPRFIAENVIPYEVKPEKFKIDPIEFENIKDVIDIKNLNRLRMDQNTEFENFLGTMFNDKDQKDDKVELPNIKRQPAKETKDQNKEAKAVEENDKEDRKIYEQLLTTHAEADEGSFEPVKFVTIMDTFDPEPITSRETDLDVGMNLTELENIAKIDEVNDDDTALETQGRTTQILEEYGLSIELSDNPTIKNHHDNFMNDSERKHQIDKSEKYTSDNTKFNQDSKHQVQEVNESKKYINDETVQHQSDKFDGFNDKSQDQLKELEEFLNEENENFQFHNEMGHQDDVPEDSLKMNLNAQASNKQKQLRQQNAFEKYVGANDNFNKKRPHQVKAHKTFVGDINHSTQFYKEVNVQVTQVTSTEKSVKYKDVATQLNKKHQHQAKEYKFSDDQEDEPDKLQVNTHFHEQRQVTEFNDQVTKPYISERHVDPNTHTNKFYRNQFLKPDKSIVGIDNNPFRKERNNQFDELDSSKRVVNPKFNTRWQHEVKKPEKIMKESKYQEVEPDLSEEVVNANTKSTKLNHYEVMKRDESLLEIDATPFEREQLVNESESFERNARPTFYTKLVYGVEKPGKLKHNINSKENKHQVKESKSLRNEGVYNQFNQNHEHNKKLDDSKTEIFDKKLDEQIDQLLKNLDVENKIRPEMIDHLNDRKVIEDTKLLELIEDKQDEKKDTADDTLLTFLLMTDNDRNKNETRKQNEQIDEDTEINRKEGMTIGGNGEYYRDLTHITNVTDDSYKIMSKSEMYDILADAIQSDEVADV